MQKNQDANKTDIENKMQNEGQEMDTTDNNNNDYNFLELATHSISVDSSSDNTYSNKQVELTKNDHFLLNKSIHSDENFTMNIS